MTFTAHNALPFFSMLSYMHNFLPFNSVHSVSTWLMFERFSYAATLESAVLAERVGFEPTIPLTVYKLYKPAPYRLTSD